MSDFETWWASQNVSPEAPYYRVFKMWAEEGWNSALINQLLHGDIKREPPPLQVDEDEE